MQLITLHICRVKYTQMSLLNIDRVDHIPSLVRLNGLPVIRLVKHRHGHRSQGTLAPEIDVFRVVGHQSLGTLLW